MDTEPEIIFATCDRLYDVLALDKKLTFNELCIQSGVNWIVVNQALEILKQQGKVKTNKKGLWAIAEPKKVRLGWRKRPKAILEALRRVPKYEVESVEGQEYCTTARAYIHRNNIQPPAIIKVKAHVNEIFYWGTIGLFGYAFFEQAPLRFPEVKAFLQGQA